MTWFLRKSCVVLVLLVGMSAYAERPVEVKWLVAPEHRGTPLPAAGVAAAGGRVLATYPDMHAIALPATAREHMGRALSGFVVQELEEVIRTPRHTIDPRVDRAPVALFDAGLYLIQFVAPPPPAWQTHLAQQDIVTVGWLPERAIIVAATAAQVARVAELPWVEYAGPYMPAYKFAPADATENDEFHLQIAYTPATQAAIQGIRERVGGFLSESSYGAQITVHVKTSLKIVRELLDEPFVLGAEKFVAPSASDERQALSLTGATSPLGGNYLNWLSQRGITPNALTDSNIVVDVADTGLDTGCTALNEHVDLVGRKVYLKTMFTQGSDTLKHGTIVAGIVGGNPTWGKTTSNGMTHGTEMKDSDSYGSFYYGLGIAPGVRIGLTRMVGGGFQGTVQQWTTSAITSRCNTPTALCSDTANLCAATVQNHSHNEYAAANAGAYTTRARLFDISVRHADHANGLPLAITMAAGNYSQFPDDPTSTQVMAAATAKNVISVGIAETARDAIPAACLNGDLEGNSNPTLRNATGGYNVLGYASRRGTNDTQTSRFKPDLIAPGTISYGPRPLLPGATYCASAGADPSFPDYHGASGTSWSAPVAAGAVALLRYKHGPQSPAMYKAMLVGGARSMTGALDRQTNGTVAKWPNVQQGFGMIALADLLSSTPAKSWHDQGTILTQGQMYERTVTVTDPLKPMRIVLAWTDAPAEVNAPIAQVNNLDLRTYGPDHYGYFGNYTSTTGYSILSTSCLPTMCPSQVDVRNNVEVININPSRFTNAANRTFTIRVTATSLNGIGVPGQSGGVNNQDFALFVLNGTLN